MATQSHKLKLLTAQTLALYAEIPFRHTHYVRVALCFLL